MNGTRASRTRTTAGTCVLLLLFGLPLALHAETTLLRGGRIFTVTQGTLEKGDLLIVGERIAAVGPSIEAPPGARIIDVSGKSVYPGLVEAYNHLGLVEIWAVEATVDIDEHSDPITPQVSVVDAIHPDSALIPVGRITGVTSALCAPAAGNVMAGMSALIHLDGDRVSKMVIHAPTALHITLGEPARGRYPDRYPMTRMGVAALLRETFTKAVEYREKLERYARERKAWEAEEKGEKDPSSPPETAAEEAKRQEPEKPARDLQLEALLPVLSGKIPVVATANRLGDIETALRLADTFGFRLVLHGATDGYKIAEELAARDIPVIVHPILTQPSSMETLGVIYENAARLAEAGVRIALHTKSPHNVRNLPFEVGRTVAFGLPWEKALEAVTINPATIFGVADEIGSIEPGKYADIVVVDGDIFQPLSRTEHLFIAGREISFENHDTRLLERYRAP
ncbi:MAG: hypothetical protein D6812_11280 [Deltaproteobacteria bacterium]|nr:MAG: hypothetical protein D6812_11280 [Deltaproteobacteria bacterium]